MASGRVSMGGDGGEGREGGKGRSVNAWVSQ